jgi:zinc and cadmium transporter
MHPLDIHWVYALGSVAIVAAFSLLGMVGLALSPKRLAKTIPWLVSLAAGALLGTAMGHLLPESIEQFGAGKKLTGLLLAGFCSFFLLEKLITLRSHKNGHSGTHSHDHLAHPETAPADGLRKPNNSLSTNILVGGAVHSFIDGIAIATAYTARTNLGIIATVAVLLHEGPHHVGDVGILIHSGLPVRKAVVLNLLASLPSFLGALLVLFVGTHAEGLMAALLPFTTANFLYIAGSTLVPEMQQEHGLSRSAVQVCLFLTGTLSMYVIGGMAG